MSDSDNQQKKTNHKKKYFVDKKWLIFIVIFLVILVGGILFIYNIQKSSTQLSKTPQEIDSEAQVIADNGDGNSARKVYDDAINKTSDSDNKVYLLLGKASIYFNEENYDQAIIVAKQAEAVDSEDYNVTKFLASAYAEKGDKQKAIEYYQKTITLVEGSDILDDHIEYYKGEIESLGS